MSTLHITDNLPYYFTVKWAVKTLLHVNKNTNPKNISFYANYFDKLLELYKNNTLNYFIKDIEDLKI